MDDQEEDYDPHQHRNVPKPTNNLESFIHLIKCALGTGILAMPQGFAHVGLIIGIVANILGGIVVTHCLHIIVRQQYKICKKKRIPSISYSDAMQVALEQGPTKLRRFGIYANRCVNSFLVIYHFGVCCVYVLYISHSLKKLVDPSYEWSINIHMLIVMIPLIILNLIPNLKILAPFSAVANIMIVIGLIAVVYFAFTAERPDESDIVYVGDFLEIPLFFGTVLFALSAIGVVIAVELNMKTPMKFRGTFGVLNTSMTCIVATYVVMGIIGYNFCRAACADSVTLNTPQDVWLAKLVVAVYGIAIFISYALHCYVPIQIIFSGVTSKMDPNTSKSKLTTINYVIRIVICLLTFACAFAVPRIGVFISLFGALCIPALGMFFPAIMEALDVKSALIWFKDVVLVIAGLVAMITGCYSAISNIIVTFMD